MPVTFFISATLSMGKDPLWIAPVLTNRSPHDLIRSDSIEANKTPALHRDVYPDSC